MHISHLNIVLCIVICWSVVNGDFSCPFDIRIDHHKVDTIRDLIVNTPRPRFSWKIPLLERNQEQTAYQIQLIERDEFFEWDSKRVLSSQSIHVPYTGQNDLLPSSYYRFRIRIWLTNQTEAPEWTKWIWFRTPVFNLHEYLTNNLNLLWIGSTKINMNELRKEFNVSNTSPIKSAIVYICGLGYYEFYLNGNKVDPSRKLDPGWTTYEKRTLIVSYDITQNITIGTNAIGVKLGNGWYSQEQQKGSQYGKKKIAFDLFEFEMIEGPPRLMFDLNITFSNGDVTEVVSDLTWFGRTGSIKHDSVYNGEFYDSRDDRLNWTRSGFIDPYSLWINPESLPSPINNTGSVTGILTLQDMPPIRSGPDALHTEVVIGNHPRSYLTEQDIGEINGRSLSDGGILQPIALWLSGSNTPTFDLGQNMAGWCRFRFQGPKSFGTYIRHAEVLTQPVLSTDHSTLSIYIENLHNATASDTYILYGDPVNEYYEPTFTVHGFRYLTIYNSPMHSMSTNDLQCFVVHSETTLKGHFTSSNPVVNQIQHNIQWGQLSNLMSVPTDCPQRNERRGWMGDAALSVNEALYNFDLIQFYKNFLNLIVDMQHPNGQIPSIVPGGIYPGDPNWSTAFPTITWQLYRHYGDVTVLETYYNQIQAYIQSLIVAYNRTGLVDYYEKWNDWLPPSPYSQTNPHLVASFAVLHDIDLILNMSIVLNKTDDVTFYSSFYNQLAEEFHHVFYNTTSNCYADGLQSAQILALALRNVVPLNLRQTVLNYLVNDINQKGNHSTTGIVSVAQLYPLLSDNGHHDLALEMISSTTHPSYGYMFTNAYENATTLWENWEAPNTAQYVSRNHIMFGSVGAWFYSHLAGIDHSSDVIIIRPRMVSEQQKHLMDKLDCQLSTLYGVVHVSYTRDQRHTIPNSILLRLTIPANAQARVQFEPLFTGGQCHTLIENNQIIWSSENVNVMDQQFQIEQDPITNLISVHVGSGQYEFQALWK